MEKIKARSNQNLIIITCILGSIIGINITDAFIGEQSFIVELCITAAVVALCDIILCFSIMAIVKRCKKDN